MAKKPIIALLTNNDDDVYCFRLELIQAIMKSGYKMLISCPDGPKFEVMEEEYHLKKKVFNIASLDKRQIKYILQKDLLSYLIAD